MASSGSGFIYKKDENFGYIMTNHHVVDGASSLIITLSNDEQVEATVLGSDQYLDLAVVKIDVKHVTQVATIGTSEDSEVGDTIFTKSGEKGEVQSVSVLKQLVKVLFTIMKV